MASALIRFAQGTNTDIAGRAVKGDLVSGAVTVSNGTDTGIVSWKYELLYVPPGSLIPLQTQGPGNIPAFVFVAPDAPGSYRVRLTTTDGVGGVDVDIRNFCVPFPHGQIAPPNQGTPPPLPLTGPGAKPNELNIGGQIYGWDGDGDATRPLLYGALKQLDATAGTLTVGANGQVFMTVGGVPAWSAQSNITHANLGGLTADDHTQYVLASGARALSGDLSAGSHKITNLATPTAPADAATKGYADSLAVTAGNGLTGTASFSVVAADGTITVSSAGVQVGSIGATNIAAGAVTLAKLDATGATGTVLTAQGVGNAPQWVAVPSTPVATTSTTGTVTLAGDLGGTGATPSVLQVHGASIPAAGSLVTGLVLQVTGANALGYGTVGAGGITPGTAYQALVSNATPATTWQTLTLGATAPIAVTNSGNVVQGTTISVASATTSTLGVVELSGDLGGSATSPSVLQVHGASVPAAGALTTGNVLQVSGASALSYGTIGAASIAAGAVTLAKFDTTGAAGTVLANAVANTPTWTNIAYSSLTGQPTLTGIAPVKVGGVSGAGQTLLTNLNVEIDGGGVANTVLAGAASGDGAYTPTPVVSTIAATASIAFTTPGLITLPGWLAFTGPAERTAQTDVGVIKHISANQAVVTPSGLQHEPASTNYCYLTETLGSWTRNVATDYADGLLDPAGGTAASDIGVASAGNVNGIYVALGGSPLVSTTMAFSVWAQTSAAPNTAALDGLTLAQAIITSSTRAALTSTWQRVSAPYSGASASLVYMFLGAPSISRAKYAFPQCEALPWSTSYIPNTAGSGSASRAATTLVAALGSTVSAQLDLTFAAAMPSAYACTVLSDGTCTIGFDASGHGVSFFNSETITGSHAYVWAVGDTVRVVVQCSGTTNTWRLFVYVNGVIQIVGGELFTHTAPFAFSTANLYVASNGLTGHIPMAGITAIASTSAVVMLGNGTVVNIQAPRNANDATPKYYVDQTTYLNVRQYGIVPGTSDNIDTEITALLAGVFPSGGSTDSGAPTLYFPAGHYRVGATIAPPDSASNFDVVGDGPQATFFDWYGPGAVPVITLTNAHKVGLKRFGVVPKINNPSVGVQVFGRISTRVGAAGTMGCVFEDMHVEACTQGFLVNAATAADGNNEQHRFVRCELLACGDGISLEQANSRGNALYSCMFESNTRSAINNALAVQSYASLLLGGSYAAYDSHFGYNALSFRVGASLDVCQVYGCFCEGDNAFFQTPIQMASDFSGNGFTMTACSWQGADHTSVFNAAGAGYFLDLVGCQIASPTGVAWSFPTAGSGVGFHGGMQSFPSGAGAAMSVANKVQLFGLRTSTASPSVTLIGAGSVTEYGTHIF